MGIDRYGDGIDHARRQHPRTLSAELIWQLLPPLTFASEDVLVTGLTEPCYDVGGDVFDYAVTDGVASMAIGGAASGDRPRSGTRRVWV